MAGRTDPEETRQEILSATLKLLAEHNYSSISMGTIAGVCEITKPAIYYHFENKQDLFRQLTLYIMKRVNGIAVKHARESGSAREKLTGICETLFSSAEQSPYVFSAYLTMLSDSGLKEIHREFTSQFEELHRVITEIIESGVENGEISSTNDPAITSRIYQSIILGFMENSILQKSIHLPAPSVLVNMLFSGIENR